LHNYLHVKNCDIKNIELDKDQSVIGALEEVDVNNRRGTNEALQVREQFVNFFN